MAVDLKKRASAPRRAAEDQTGASGPNSVSPSRWRFVAGVLAGHWRMACSKVSQSSRQLGQVVGAGLSQEGWAGQ